MAKKFTQYHLLNLFGLHLVATGPYTFKQYDLQLHSWGIVLHLGYWSYYVDWS